MSGKKIIEGLKDVVAGRVVMPHSPKVVCVNSEPTPDVRASLELAVLMAIYPKSQDFKSNPRFLEAMGNVYRSAIAASPTTDHVGVPRELIEDLAASGVEFDDERLRYVTIQVNRQSWNELKALAAREGK